MKPDGVSSIFWLIVGIPVVYLSYRLGLGELTRPGPGFLTFWCGLILCALSVVVFIRDRIADSGETAKGISQLWIGVKWSKALISLTRPTAIAKKDKLEEEEPVVSLTTLVFEAAAA